MIISVADLVVSVATDADAPGMVDVIHTAFEARPPLDPPSTAVQETPASIRAQLEPGSKGSVGSIGGRRHRPCSGLASGAEPNVSAARIARDP